MFTRPPLEPEWQAQLASQTGLEVTATTALAEVQRAWVATLALTGDRGAALEVDPLFFVSPRITSD